MNSSLTRKRMGMMVAVAAVAMMVPSVTFAGSRDSGRSRGHESQRYDSRDSGRRSSRYSNSSSRHSSRRHSDRHSRKSGFNLSFLFGNTGHISRNSYTSRNVWVNGRWNVRVTPAVYETRYQRCGTPYQVIVRPAYNRRVWVPGHYANSCSHGCCSSGGAHRYGNSHSGARITFGGRF